MSRLCASRLVASVLAGAVSLWSLAPVCGGATDVDPAACCERHAPCHETAERGASKPDPARCCEVGEHSYPAAHLQSAAVAPLPPALPAEVLVVAPPAPAQDQQFAEPLLKVPRTPLYVLSSNYRI
jgi:hypothetical protein